MWSPSLWGDLHDWWDMENQSCWYCSLWSHPDPPLEQMLPISMNKNSWLLDMTFLHQQLSALLSSCIWCCELGYKSINISEQPAASIYRVITLFVVWLTKDFYPASFEVSKAQQLSIMFSLGMALHQWVMKSCCFEGKMFSFWVANRSF